MNDSQIRLLDAGQRVREYAKTRPADFPAGSRAALKQLREALSELDAIMRNKYRADPGSLAARRVERAPKKAKKAAPPPPLSQ